MIDDGKLNEIFIHEEMLLEGLPKGFWRLIKLSSPEIWEMPEEVELEYAWVVAIMGNRCVFYDEINEGFIITRYERHGELGEGLLNMEFFLQVIHIAVSIYVLLIDSWK